MELIKLPLLCPASCLPSCLLLLCGMSMVYISSYRGLVAPYTRMYTSVVAFWLVAALFVVAALLLGLVDRMITSSSRE